MTARDRWIEKFVCPACKKTGTANIWQEDGWSFIKGDMSTHVDFISDGFQLTHKKLSHDIICKKCNIETNEIRPTKSK